MPDRCSVPGCSATNGGAGKRNHLFCFPRDPVLSQVWAKAVKREITSTFPTKYSRVDKIYIYVIQI